MPLIINHQINMTKIQSLPVIETPWKYAFFVEGTFPDYQQYKEALRLLEVMSEDLKVLGEYQNNYK
jgi:prephenate dehydratase